MREESNQSLPVVRIPWPIWPAQLPHLLRVGSDLVVPSRSLRVRPHAAALVLRTPADPQGWYASAESDPLAFGAGRVLARIQPGTYVVGLARVETVRADEVPDVARRLAALVRLPGLIRLRAFRPLLVPLGDSVRRGFLSPRDWLRVLTAMQEEVGTKDALLEVKP